MELRQRPRIGVMGPAVCSPQCRRLARDVGFHIGRQGGILICGGLGGVMEAAAAGVREAGGITVGILPRAAAADANPYIDIPIVTDMGHARNVINVLTSQVIIAVHGAYGTLSEIALALKSGTPVVGLETWRLIPPQGGSVPEITVADTPEDAVRLALTLIQNRAR